MYVLATTDYLNNVGGAELSAREIVTALVDQDSIDGVTVVGVDLPGEERLKYPGADVVSVRPPIDPRRFPDYVVDEVLARVLARKVKRLSNEADVVHAHHRRSTLALARLQIDIPTVSTVRDFWPICPISVYHVDGQQCTGCDGNLDECVAHQGWDGFEPKTAAIKQYMLAKRRQQRPALTSVDCGVFIANHLRETIGESIELPSTVARIPNPVSLPNDVDVVAERSATPKFVTASSLTEEKGVETAIRAMSKVSAAYPDAQLVVLGNGPLRNYLESLASKIVPGAISFRGRVPSKEVYKEMATATATIFPSKWSEPFGRISIESMLLGTPIIGSSVGGIAEVIDEEETGLLFPAGDADALADHINTLIETPEKWKALSEAGPDAAARFSAEQIADEYIELYQQLVGV